MVKFQVKKQKPKIKLQDDQRSFLKTLLEIFNSIEWKPEDIHNAIYETTEKQKIPIKTGFKTIYQIILNQEKGPRVGFFLSNLDKQFVTKRIEEAIK